MHDALTDLEDHLATRVSPERLDNATALAWSTYRRLADDELATLDLDAAAVTVDRALQLFETGRPGTPTILIEDSGDSSILLVHIADGPFMMSTILEELHRLDLEPVDLAHPAVGVRRDADGRLVEITAARGASHREAYISLDLQTRLSDEQKQVVVDRLHAVLADALRVVEDFRPMTTALEAVVTAMEAHGDSEEAEFLQWLLDDHFVFLGYRSGADGLGLLRDESSVSLDELDGHDWADSPVLDVTRTAGVSPVHRQVRMTSIAVRPPHRDGDRADEHRILGLLAQKAFVQPSSTVPVLRRKLRAVLDDVDVVDHSQDERAIRTLFDALPKQELFELTHDALRDALINLVDVSRRGGVRLTVRRERNGRSVSVLVTLPRERFSAALREEIQQLLAGRLGATSVDYQLSLTERDQPLLHFTLQSDDGLDPAPIDLDALQREITSLARTYTDALAAALVPHRGSDEARSVAKAWCAGLPPAYTETTPIAMATIDIEELERLDGPDAVRMRLVEPAGTGSTGRPGLLRFRLYKSGPGVELSDFLPLLESMGLTVVEEQPYALLEAPVWDEVHIHDYGVRSSVGEIDVASDGPRIAAAVASMWSGRSEVDSLNRLVIAADTGIDLVTVLRAYRRYGRQVGTSYTEATINDALLEHPRVAAALLAYFEARFDPARPDSERQAAEEAARAAVTASLEEVARLDQDRILRTFLGLIDATLRTNVWQRRPWLSFKFDSGRVPEVPKPVPYREIFVYSAAMEGVHLRGGPIARGGLRWSDRVDDFRTEVLGLMKAQMSKNAVIVPTGSKGGFVLKARPDDRDALAEAVRAQYRVFISGLLDLTDDLDGETVVPPNDVVRHDDADPYLVVAADKGTATFSDLANSISQEYGFWLDDAFASGGSQGYDHKAMGITARGAWVAVQRHFRELGIDVQEEPIDVVGVGDMSGDVFGNGLLRSKAVRLVAAFDHRDIFIDPAPDPATSYAERQRLYELPRSTWQDYDRALISSGGGVWSRTSKSVPLSPEARELLRIDQEEISPPELISVLLRAHVDLLWFGGIGTYVKSPDESHTEVGDRANDAIRVNANEVGARVVGEGGNLAMTQRGRIAYSRRGGRCNTDAIDNVAGVNTSDREVNLKILLRRAIEAGTLDPTKRDDLLASLTDEVGDAVLRDSYKQTWAISQEVNATPGGMGSYEDLMARLEEQGRLDRDVEVLPDTAEMIRRRADGAILTRPELSVLLAYSKIDLTDQLLASDIIDQPVVAAMAREYFPDTVSERFPEAIESHQLRREIVATVVAGDVCDRMGITWAGRVAGDLGVDIPTVVGAYWIARGVIQADQSWRRVERLDGRADPVLQFELKGAIDWLVDAFTRSYIRQGRTNDIAAAIDVDRPVLVELCAADAAADRSSAMRLTRQAAQRWVDLGIDEQVAEDIALLPSLSLVPGISATAARSGRSVADCGEVYALLAARLPIEGLSHRLQRYEPHGRWERGQHRGLIDDLRRLQHGLARLAIDEAGPSEDPAAIVTTALARRSDALQAAESIAAAVLAQPDVDLNAVAVAVRSLAALWTDSGH
ncbi:NAD-glutamate dehydrogenase [Euzebya tangerina]|uniref:NAD-glutamate dehydrogenase n=1 Tax=Euzebya tangerina TaxID=591198 RepID=UPI000E30B566|nr:NAD-glutamate dehydrogenase domain-containing protein [Euzebya tangerina]